MNLSLYKVKLNHKDERGSAWNHVEKHVLASSYDDAARKAMEWNLQEEDKEMRRKGVVDEDGSLRRDVVRAKSVFSVELLEPDILV